MKSRIVGIALALGLFLTGAGPAFADKEHSVPPVWFWWNNNSYAPFFKLEMQDMAACIAYVLSIMPEDGDGVVRVTYKHSFEISKVRFSDIRKMDIKDFAEKVSIFQPKDGWNVGQCVRTASK